MTADRSAGSAAVCKASLLASTPNNTSLVNVNLVSPYTNYFVSKKSKRDDIESFFIFISLISILKYLSKKTAIKKEIVWETQGKSNGKLFATSSKMFS